MKYNRYNNGKIYKIVNNVDDMVYIGSTCLSLSKRKHLHKTEQVSGKSPNRRLFLHIKKYGWDEFDIYLVEQFSCHTKDQLRQREEYHRMQVSPDICLNMCRAFATTEDKKLKIIIKFKVKISVLPLSVNFVVFFDSNILLQFS